ncbi:DUF4123 domain-containing protein [Pseudomonas sp. 5P_3.1_Bac2]|uniref:DUF4123 domain-containing protein n=1 Tax=Pseudomonas sp. 5P_3.1_Bac2 TaxID=2971617 RepID=UPI0021C6A49E|nr:DUF4123 domain-containing protein [Pseudomonas sp. 5P_3.1_Bac2]MCU1717545.1 DUF4123 domain-containing protein [Pseudomonas sp. 5P_3.1_Bac2]
MSLPDGFRGINDEVRARLAEIPDLQLYALVDGAKYLTLGNRLDSSSTQWQWLLAGTELETIKHAGPALVHLKDDGDLQNWLVSRDRKEPWVCWLMSTHGFDVLVKHLGSLLFTRLPDGRKSLFRYYNPTVRRSLDSVLTVEQRQQMMGPVNHWLVWQPLGTRYLAMEAASHGGLNV